MITIKNNTPETTKKPEDGAKVLTVEQQLAAMRQNANKKIKEDKEKGGEGVLEKKKSKSSKHEKDKDTDEKDGEKTEKRHTKILFVSTLKH